MLTVPIKEFDVLFFDIIA